MKTGLITSNTYQNHNTGEGHPEQINRVSVILENFKKKNNKKVYTAKETLSVEYAGFWIRFLAIMMDTFMIITPIGVIIGIVFGYETLKDPDNNVWAGVIQILLYSIVTLSMWYKFDQTPGKKALHLYIVNAKTFKNLSD